MLESSKDVLFIILAFCALLFTVFICWFIYYLIAMVKNAYKVTNSIKAKLDLVEDVLKAAKNKLNSTANYISILMSGVEKVVDYVQTKNRKYKEEENLEGFEDEKPKRKRKTKNT